jgi:hypothetical protein
MAFVVALAPPLALALSLVLLALYRRAVVRAMARLAEPAPDRAAPALQPAGAVALAAAAPVDDPDLLASLRRGRQRAIARIGIAGLAYAATIALALVAAMAQMRSPFGFALAAWGALWPVIPALWLAVPAGGRAARSRRWPTCCRSRRSSAWA